MSSSLISGILSGPSFEPTVNAGEYSFVNLLVFVPKCIRIL